MAGRVLALVFAWLALALAASGVHAQAAPSVPAQLDHAQADLRDLGRSARAPDLGDTALAKLYADVAPIEAEIHQAIDPLRSAVRQSRRAAERARAGAQARRAAGSCRPSPTTARRSPPSTWRSTPRSSAGT